MRARMAVLAAAALLLSACTEGVAPRAPQRYEDPQEAPATPPADPVAPTDVLGEAPGTPRPTPPPAPDGEAVPEPPPLTGSAAVVGGSTLGLSSTSQVDVDLTVSGVRGRGTVDVEFISPSGHPYERRSTVVETAPEVPRTLRFSLPVAGTTVATTGMSGRWQVRFFLDGAPLTVATFTLEP